MRRTLASLKDVHARLQRAEHHMSVLTEELSRWLNTDGFDLAVGQDDDGWHRVQFARVPDPPESLSLTLADMLNNARSALDHLAWQLVILDQGSPDRNTSFPIASGRQAWVNACRRNLRGLTSEHVRRIESIQPFHDPNPELHPLAYLNEANNRNKHRFLARAIVNRAQVITSVGWQNPRPRDASILLRKPRNPEIRAGAVILSARAEPVDFEINVNVRSLKAGIAFDMDIDRTGDMPDVVACCRAIVEQFVADFEDLG